VERYEYQEYGKFSVFGSDGSPRSSPTWRHLFQGRDYDAALNVYDFRARTLWPDIGRFGQEDPAKIGANLSLYQAFGGSPLNLTNPSGLYEEDVHHYLTRYLANAVGYDGAASESIGYETGHLDFDERDAMYGGRNVKSWEVYHFVSKERLDHMQSDVLTSASENDRQIGEYLHALEDSYSHQSNPGRREWGARFLLQSVAGHGAKGHDPDQTWRRRPWRC
jgi:RHS repeat-associated protein